MHFFPRLLALAATLLTVTQATNSSELFYGQSYANLSLALTAVADTGDIFFRWSAPSEYDWVAFGIGAQMKGALMIVMYTSKNGSAVTISPRIATGHAEPAYTPDIIIERVDVANDPFANSIDTTNGGYMHVSAVCRNCVYSPWSPPINITSTAQPFMFAIGPVNDGTSTRQFDELDAPLRSHTIHGQFTMDMRQAIVQFGGNVTVPALRNATDGASGVERLTNSPHDYSSAAHALVLCLAFGLLLPMDAILFRLFRKSRVHYVLQGILGVLFVVGLAIGFYVSTIFVRSKNMSSPHQVLGIVLLLIWLAQAGLGFLYHRRKTQSPTTALTPAPKCFSNTHLALTGLMFLLGIIDAAIGFNFALSPSYNKAWVPLVIGATIIVLIATGTRYCIDTRRGDKVDDERLERETADAWAQYHEEQRVQREEFERYGRQQGKDGGVVVQSYELQGRPAGHGEGEVQYQSVSFPKAH